MLIHFNIVNRLNDDITKVRPKIYCKKFSNILFQMNSFIKTVSLKTILLGNNPWLIRFKKEKKKQIC